MTRIFLSIGSNINPATNIQLCAKTLDLHFTEIVWSPIYQSAAIGMQGDDFLNAVVSAQTQLSIDSLLSLLKELEHEQGRIRTENKFSSRTLDIDLLLFHNEVIDTAGLTLPRIEITSAAHVLKPLADIFPDGIHPLHKKTYHSLWQDLKERHPERCAALTLVDVAL